MFKAMVYTPINKVTQHAFYPLYIYGVVFIMLGIIILKAWLFVFPLILHLL